MIAPDLRGFGRSVAPEGVEAYGLPIVLSDIVALLDALGVERANGRAPFGRGRRVA